MDQNASDVLNGLSRALGLAGAALQALALVDLIVELAHIDCLSGALSSAGTAGQALVGNNKSHGIPSIKNIRFLCGHIVAQSKKNATLFFQDSEFQLGQSGVLFI
jgi:hypothetical protein